MVYFNLETDLSRAFFYFFFFCFFLSLIFFLLFVFRFDGAMYFIDGLSMLIEFHNMSLD